MYNNQKQISYWTSLTDLTLRCIFWRMDDNAELSDKSCHSIRNLYYIFKHSAIAMILYFYWLDANNNTLWFYNFSFP